MTNEARKEAIEFARKYPNSHVATVENNKPYVRVMQCVRLDDDLTVWYATSATSNKVRQIKANPHVCAVFYSEAKYVRVMGKAEIITDPATKADLWEDEWSRWWPKGKDDPDYVLIKITPEEADYLDLMKDPATLEKII